MPLEFPQIPDAGILGDWLEDHYLDRRLAEPPRSIWTLYGDGDGDGYGYGDGDGDGNGDGYGYGYGYGDGYGAPKPGGELMPIVGKRMLVFCGLSFAFVGDVAEQTGPYSYRLENASMLCRTGGVPWDELADGKRRGEATFRYQGNISVGPFFSWSREWAGSLPGKNHKE